MASPVTPEAAGSSPVHPAEILGFPPRPIGNVPAVLTEYYAAAGPLPPAAEEVRQMGSIYRRGSRANPRYYLHYGAGTKGDGSPRYEMRAAKGARTMEDARKQL